MFTVRPIDVFTIAHVPLSPPAGLGALAYLAAPWLRKRAANSAMARSTAGQPYGALGL